MMAPDSSSERAIPTPCSPSEASLQIWINSEKAMQLIKIAFSLTLAASICDALSTFLASSIVIPLLSATISSFTFSAGGGERSSRQMWSGLRLRIRSRRRSP
ncbi:hypothetical protein COCNU_13G007830 [Cocos nucifera]|uniref:Uncharacterized protein n=1 Tax=Cocos nucifera TaxID=13894 RepID=A0A8K0NBR5_COCNU|nr:hypothetical protein COCNU_13G007830 [Cocos nucifera]